MISALSQLAIATAVGHFGSCPVRLGASTAASTIVRYPSTPKAVASAGLLLGAERGCLIETSAGATERKRLSRANAEC
jgi:hypothetical protein